ncbi:Os1348 family NHLP clan protein [Candidatus Leptofilum sp.]|uniref:Os1348 family NHLP clan protein n=1 Tax=Candidatus Leptofilum sp. TaxID=3241576 RepID=UPI003B5BDF55
MSIQAIDEVLNRWFIDRQFRQQLREDPERALAGFDLTPAQRSRLFKLKKESLPKSALPHADSKRRFQMTKKQKVTESQLQQFARLQAWVMSFVCAMLCLFAAAAATRIPLYLETADYTRLIGVILFALAAIVGLVDNIRTHIWLWRLQKEIV